jgi:hypothetical protein
LDRARIFLEALGLGLRRPLNRMDENDCQTTHALPFNKSPVVHDASPILSDSETPDMCICNVAFHLIIPVK